MIRIRRKTAALAERSSAAPPVVDTAPAEPAVPPAGAASAAPEEALIHRRLSARRFPALLAAAGLAGAGLVAAGPRRAEAAYSTGTAPDGGDLVDTHLTVQGNLTVNGNTGVGTATPRVKLDVHGPIASNGGGFVSDLGGAHVGYNTYWAPGRANLDAANPGMFVRFDQNSAVLYLATAAANPALTMKGGWNSYGDVFYQLGRVGIGTGGPVEALDVVGNARLSGTLIVNGAVAIDAGGVATKSYYAP